MQCSSCQFENMPGIQVCGRCGAQLNLERAEIDVEPPRASARAKRWRKLLPIARVSSWLHREMPEPISRMRAPDFDRPLPGIIVRMTVPGWAHFYTNQAGRGKVFLALFLGFLVFAVVFVGTTLGNLSLGLMVAVHISSVLDLVYTGCSTWEERAAYTALFCLGIALIIYFPAVWALTSFVRPLQILADTPPFRAGDVVLYNPSAFDWSSPEVGDVVIYDIPAGQQVGQGVANVVYAIQGLRLDRIVAGPKQVVEWNGKQMLVDGKPASYLPLNPNRLPEALEFTVPDGSYAILPTTDPYVHQGFDRMALQMLSCVPAGSLRGRVFLRHQPLHRFWFVR